jgi:hypothetical protein
MRDFGANPFNGDSSSAESLTGALLSSLTVRNRSLSNKQAAYLWVRRMHMYWRCSHRNPLGEGVARPRMEVVAPHFLPPRGEGEGEIPG